MTIKAIVAAYMQWLQQRGEKVAIREDGFYQIVPSDFNRNTWKDASKHDIIKFVGKDAMLNEIGLKK